MYHHPPLQAENGNTQSINAIKSVNATCAKAVWLLLWPMIPASCNVNEQVGASVKGTGKCRGRGPDFCQTKTKELWDQHSRDNERHERHLKTRSSKVARHQYQPSFFGSYRTLNLKHPCAKILNTSFSARLQSFWNFEMTGWLICIHRSRPSAAPAWPATHIDASHDAQFAPPGPALDYPRNSMATAQRALTR